jgi:tRNA(adenine34) deaminase
MSNVRIFGPAPRDEDSADPDTDLRWMRRALREAETALDSGEVPIGCVVVLADRVIGRGWNRVETTGDPTAHAEMLAITAATSTVGYSRLEGARVYVTVEPCLMCAGALLLARVDAVIFGASEPKFGALGSRLRIQDAGGFNHRYLVRGGVLAEESASLLREFFRSLRERRRTGSGAKNGCDDPVSGLIDGRPDGPAAK